MDGVSKELPEAIERKSEGMEMVMDLMNWLPVRIKPGRYKVVCHEQPLEMTRPKREGEVALISEKPVAPLLIRKEALEARFKDERGKIREIPRTA